MSNFTESTIEHAAIDWLKELGYNYAFGPEIAFGGAVRAVGQAVRVSVGEGKVKE